MIETAVSEKIKSICVNYVAFTIECAMNKDLKEKFKADPKPYLNDQVGMKIPYDDNVKVVLDESRWRWPIALVKSDEGEFVIEEGRLEVSLKGEEYYKEIQDYIEQQKVMKAAPMTSRDLKHNIYVKSPQDFEQTHKYEHSGKIDAVIEGMQVKDIVIILPFMDTEVDMLGEIEYNEGSEIVLTSST